MYSVEDLVVVIPSRSGHRHYLHSWNERVIVLSWCCTMSVLLLSSSALIIIFVTSLHCCDRHRICTTVSTWIACRWGLLIAKGWSWRELSYSRLVYVCCSSTLTASLLYNKNDGYQSVLSCLLLLWFQPCKLNRNPAVSFGLVFFIQSLNASHLFSE